MTPESYNDNFFNYHLQDSLESARVVIPIVKELIQPNSVVDIGCGIGTWLSIWRENGVFDMLGVDGGYVNKEELLINRDNFIEFDLEAKFELDRKFDLVSCLEVAEHISSDSSKNLINTLCDLGDFILFSAAIPGQEGTMHINEQYPDYWIKLFSENGYVPIDCIRKKIWLNDKVSWWYRQNILLFVNKDKVKRFKIVEREYELTDTDFINFVHPRYFEYKNMKIKSYEQDIYSYQQRLSNYENIMKDKVSLMKALLRNFLK